MSGVGLIPSRTVAPRTLKCSPSKSYGASDQAPRTTDRNSSVRAYRTSFGAVSPNRACSVGSPPVTTLSMSRPPDSRW